MIHSVHVENLRVIKSAETTLEPLTVLVGPNGAGKSTLMDAIGAMLVWGNQRIRESGNVYYQQESRLFPTYFKGWIEFDTCEKSSNSSKQYRLEVARRDAANVQPAIQWSFKENGAWVKPGNQPNQNIPPSDFDDMPQFVLPLRLQPDLLKRPSPKQFDLKVFPADGNGLAAFVANMKLHQDEHYSFLKKALSAVVPTVTNVIFDSATDVNNYKLEFVTTGGVTVPAVHISDGTIFTVALIAALTWSNGRPGVVMIDDLDHGLHPKAQQELIAQLRQLMKLLPGLQIIATAHSPYLLDQLEPSEIRCMIADSKLGTQIAKLSDHSDFEKWKDEMTPGEFWSTVGEKWVADISGGK